MLVYPRVKNRHELLGEASSSILEVINELTEALEDSEIQDNESSEVLENTENINDESSEVLENIENINDKLFEVKNTENINDESSQLTTLNEQKVDEFQQVNLLPRKRGSRYISTSSNIG